MKKRLFIAIPISAKSIKYILHWEKKQKVEINWISSTDLHITLIPPFYEDSEATSIEKMRSIKNLLTKFILDFNLIEIRKAQIDRKSRPLILWIRGDTNYNLQELLKNLNKIFFSDVQLLEFIPHITLARFKAGKINLNKFKNIKINLVEKVTKITLYESVTPEKNLKRKYL